MVDLAHCNRIWIFLLGMVACLLAPIIWHVRLFYFIPFLIVTFYQCSYVRSLWLSLFCGALVDIFSVHSFFGMNALTYTLTTAVLYPQRRYFFADRLTTLPLMTGLFSLISTGLLVFCVEVLEGQKLVTWSFIYTDFMVMPLYDTVYALAIVTLPQSLYRMARQRRF